VAEHQGWQPPPKWTPVAGAPRAPRNWVYWEHNAAVWSESSRRFTRAARSTVVAGWILATAGLALVTAALLFSMATTLLIVACTIATVGVIVAARGHANLRRANKRAYLAVVIAERHSARIARSREQFSAWAPTRF
jgi:hypothetical protein